MIYIWDILGKTPFHTDREYVNVASLTYLMSKELTKVDVDKEDAALLGLFSGFSLFTKMTSLPSNACKLQSTFYPLMFKWLD